VSGRAAAVRTTARAHLVLASILALLAAAPYLAGGVSRNFITFDDNIYVYENPRVLQGLTAQTALWALTSTQNANWHPTTWLSHLADVSLFGLDARGHHLTSVLLHALNTALLFLALARLSGRAPPAAFVAALFGVHPLHVESVAWVAERKDVLAAFFFMLVLLAYERYARRGGGSRYLLTVLLLALGLAAKPMLVTVPFVLLLLDFWPLGRTLRPGAGAGILDLRALGKLCLEKLPLLALSCASAVVTLVAQRGGGAVQDVISFRPAVRIANAIVAWPGYLGKTLWPSSLAIYYPHPLSLPPLGKIASSLALLALLTAIAVRGVRRRPWLIAGWCWYLGMLVPVIGLVQIGAQSMADRYTYLPLCGIFIMVAWSVSGAGTLRRLPRGAIAAAACLAVAALAAATAVQAGRWKDSETLFTHTLAVTRDNWMIQNNLATVYARSGRYEEAAAHAREALRIRPDLAEAGNNLGISLAVLGRHAEAAAILRDAIRVRPDLPEAWYNLGLVLTVLGRREEAVADFRQALQLRPDYPAARLELKRLGVGAP
jgi:tetratricopeptide (TPR) repeat protein